MDKQQQGFSVIELVVAIVIMGIIAAYVGINWPFGDATVGAQAEQLARDIRHTQMIAMSQNRQLTLTVSSGGYSVTESGSTINDPAGSGPFSEAFRDGVSASGGSLTFDGLGRPIVIGSGLASSSTSFSVSGSSMSYSVSVAPITGFVSVSP